MMKGNELRKHVQLVSKVLACNCEKEGDSREMKIKINKARVAAGLPEKYETWYRGRK